MIKMSFKIVFFILDFVTFSINSNSFLLKKRNCALPRHVTLQERDFFLSSGVISKSMVSVWLVLCKFLKNCFFT